MNELKPGFGRISSDSRGLCKLEYVTQSMERVAIIYERGSEKDVATNLGDLVNNPEIDLNYEDANFMATLVGLNAISIHK